MRRFATFALLFLTACGSDRPTAPSGPQRTQIHANNFRVDPRSITHTDFTAPQGGTLVVVVDWTLPSNRILTSLSTPSCDLYNGGTGCGSFFAQNLQGTKPAEFRYGGAIAGQAYRVYIANDGTQTDNGVINVYLER